MIVGAGLSAADAIIAARQQRLPVNLKLFPFVACCSKPFFVFCPLKIFGFFHNQAGKKIFHRLTKKNPIRFQLSGQIIIRIIGKPNSFSFKEYKYNSFIKEIFILLHSYLNN
jgi:hypothetical protein